MLRYFRRIDERAQELGNHRRKYIHAIETYGRCLVDRLEASGLFDRVHLRQTATDVGAEMDAIAQAARDEKERLNLLGCYYAIQFLNMNVQSIDRLRSSSTQFEDKTSVYREFLQKTGDDFGILIREYLTRILDIFLGDGPRPKFVVCTVGTRLHQDDVDMGIIDDGSPLRGSLNKAVSKMAQEMMRWTSLPDFYLSEHIGGRGYAVSIDEYVTRLDSKILDFVSVSELLSAYPIMGNTPLFRRFDREIRSRYYYNRRKTSQEHEGYLRGLVGEIESLLLWPSDPRHINPKNDLLRLVIAILWAYRTARGVRETDVWATFQKLAKSSAKTRGLFHGLERNYTYVETFRHLYQQFAAQEETIDLTDARERDSLKVVANAMGFEDLGVMRARHQLLVHYTEHVNAGRRAIRALLHSVCEHIKRVTVFTEWFRPKATGGIAQTPRRLAVDFFLKSRYFHGIKYWHDLLDQLEAEDSGLLEELLAELETMEQAQRTEIVEYLANWGYHTFFALLRLLTIIGSRAKKHESLEVFRLLNNASLDLIRGTPDEIRRFSTVFMYHPQLVHRYLSLIDDKAENFLYKKLSGPVWVSQVAAWQKRLLGFWEVRRKSSRFFRRAIDRVCERHPEFLLYFGNPEKLQRASRGILADLMRLSSYEGQRLELGVCYDLQFLRIGLGTLQGMPLARLDAEFTEFSDQYLEILFDICKAEVDVELGQQILTHDLLGLFVAGGHARGRAHQGDYDLIVLLNSDSDEMLNYTSRILTRLNREIVKRGIIPQYRLADNFGGYVTRFSELERYLMSSGDQALIEMSQLIGARMVVGSSRLEHEFRERIVKKCIYSQKKLYANAVLEEIRSRREYERRMGQELRYHVKECRGGLRDLELGMLLWKVIYEIDEPIGSSFWQTLCERRPERREDFLVLKESYQFLNRLRDVYRLTVVPSNLLDPQYFDQPADVLGYKAECGLTASERLRQDFRSHRDKAAETLDALLADMGDAPSEFGKTGEKLASR
jgi:hypothetical protein